jgi:2'-hydroxyisoflavone reductase
MSSEQGNKMNVLIIGGTKFLGRALVVAAREKGHTVTLFHRGQTNPGLFTEVEEILGDRNTDLAQLQNRHWDVVIDTCGYTPEAVRKSAGQLASQVDQYIFISSISVYSDFRQAGIEETAPLEQLPEGADEAFKPEHYGALKALCEQTAEAQMPGRVLNIRPGLIVGPHDPTDRFTYWPFRVAQGGEVLAPERPGIPVQVINVRDLAEWTIAMAEKRQMGIYNATGPVRPLSLGEVFESSRQVSGSDARFTWVNEAFLHENNVQPWSDLPLWLPESDPSLVGMQQVNVQKAVADGLSFRPLAETIRATLEWANERPASHEWQAGLNREREQALLVKYRAGG